MDENEEIEAPVGAAVMMRSEGDEYVQLLKEWLKVNHEMREIRKKIVDLKEKLKK